MSKGENIFTYTHIVVENELDTLQHVNNNYTTFIHNFDYIMDFFMINSEKKFEKNVNIDFMRKIA